MSRPVHMLLSLPSLRVGPASVAMEIANEMRGTGLDPTLYVPSIVDPLPPGVRARIGTGVKLPGRIAALNGVERFARRRTERRLLTAVKREGRGTLVWLWPDASLDLIKALREAGATMVHEMINTQRGTAKRILDSEAARVGIVYPYPISQASVAREQEALNLVDYVVSPSEAVDASLREWGMADDRIIRAGFGWNPADLAGDTAAAITGNGPMAIFAGSGSLRKGLHLLLPAWRKAATGGTLIIVGNIEAAVTPLIQPYRDDPGIVWVPFTRNLPDFYRAADYMIFPTLEEGAPLVCYHAAALGLPIITSPMGQARIVENGVSGIVVNPFDEEALVGAIRRLSTDAGLRASLAENARRRADRMTWANAAAERARAIAQRSTPL